MANWRNNAMREPLPKEFVIEAWKARVGYSRERSLTHVAYLTSISPMSYDVLFSHQAGYDIMKCVSHY